MNQWNGAITKRSYQSDAHINWRPSSYNCRSSVISKERYQSIQQFRIKSTKKNKNIKKYKPKHKCQNLILILEPKCNWSAFEALNLHSCSKCIGVQMDLTWLEDLRSWGLEVVWGCTSHFCHLMEASFTTLRELYFLVFHCSLVEILKEVSWGFQELLGLSSRKETYLKHLNISKAEVNLNTLNFWFCAYLQNTIQIFH